MRFIGNWNMAGVSEVRRYLMYYPHVPGPVFRRLDRGPWWQVGRFVLTLGKALGPLGGNKVQLVAHR